MLDAKMNVRDDILIVELKGDLDNSTAPGLEEQLKAKRDEVKQIVFDASKLEYLSSAGLRVIMAIELYMKDAGKEKTQMINANETILEIIGLSGFDKVVEVVE